jgi:ComF family protein
MRSFFTDLIHLFFPEICSACATGLVRGEKTICLDCHLHLPQTRFHDHPGNAAEKQLSGLCPVVAVTSLWHFNKSTRVQKLIHNLKYAGHRDAGELAGNLLAQQLLSSPRFSGLDGVIPVPLHRVKRLKRGYNQSECFARGLATTMNLPLHTDWLLRVSDTSTQTKRGRRSRHEAVENAFAVDRRLARPGHYLLVDDVITTGATLISCVNALSAVEGVRVSAASMAFARR